MAAGRLIDIEKEAMYLGVVFSVKLVSAET